VLAVVLDERLKLALWVAFVLSLWVLPSASRSSACRSCTTGGCSTSAGLPGRTAMSAGGSTSSSTPSSHERGCQGFGERAAT
jgi:hypothetical protein